MPIARSSCSDVALPNLLRFGICFCWMNWRRLDCDIEFRQESCRIDGILGCKSLANNYKARSEPRALLAIQQFKQTRATQSIDRSGATRCPIQTISAKTQSIRM